MIVSAKLYDSDSSHIPIEVMEKAIEEWKNKKDPATGQSAPKLVTVQQPGQWPSLINTAGMVKEIEWKGGTELWALMELAPTPKGKMIMELIENGGKVKYSPQFAASFDKEGKIEKLEVISINVDLG
jgi:3,4-dihydroxy-2-butanone 4-phosphate synthase